MTTPKAKVLIVDDEQSILLTVSAILNLEGYETETADCGEVALEKIRMSQFDLVLTDFKMREVDGLAVLAEVQKRQPAAATVMMTGHGSLEIATRALKLGASEYLMKPVDVEALKLAVERSLERKRLSQTESLYRLSQRLATAASIDTIACDVCEAVCGALGIAGAELISTSPNARQTSVFRAALSAGDTLSRLASSEIVEIDSRRAVTDGDVPASVVLVPGIVNDQLHAVLVAHNSAEPYEFHASVLRFLQAVANLAAATMANLHRIDDLRASNQELEAANTKLRELDKLKSQFLNVATHELRTPLSVILGYNSMLADSLADRLTEEERGTMTESVGACKRLIRLVNSMLDLNRFAAGRMQLDHQVIDVRDLVRSVCTLLNPQALAKSISLCTVVPTYLSRVEADPERLTQVLVNLVANAIKFTPEHGGVTVEVREAAGRLEIVVADTGIGIDPAEQKQIFEEFVQASSARRGEGSGLGLAIARRIVEAHNGYISVMSEPGHGSRFTVSLPLRRDGKRAVSA